MTKTRSTTANSTYPKVAVMWLNQALCFYQSLCLVDSEVLLNRHLRVAANRSPQAPSLSRRSACPPPAGALRGCLRRTVVFAYIASATAQGPGRRAICEKTPLSLTIFTIFD